MGLLVQEKVDELERNIHDEVCGETPVEAVDALAGVHALEALAAAGEIRIADLHSLLDHCVRKFERNVNVEAISSASVVHRKSPGKEPYICIAISGNYA